MSAQVTNVPARTNAVREFARRHTLLLFIALVYALTWPLMVADVLGTRGVLPGRLPLGLMLLQAFMPTIAALALAGLAGGRAEAGALLRRLLIWRVGLRWWVVAIFGFALLCLGAVLIHNGLALGPALPLFSAEAAQGGAGGLAINSALLLIIGVFTNGEELAWRGFALPRLQARHNALVASIILGVPWALFHLPLFFAAGSSQADTPPLSTLISSIGLSVLFTWVFNNARGSVLLVTILHAAVNTWTRILPIDHGSAELSWALTGVICVAAVAVAVASGARNLARGVQRIQYPESTPAR